MKHEDVKTTPKASWLVDSPAASKTQNDLAMQIMNIMEQGIIVWTAQGYCELHNTRVFDVLDIDTATLTIGTKMSDFLAENHRLGRIDAQSHERVEKQFRSGKPFAFDQHTGSGRVVAANARPARGGGYVVTYTDVTAARDAAQELAAAKLAAEQAREQATAILGQERARQKEAERLAQLDEWLQSCKSLAELYEIVTTFMRKLLPNSAGQLFIYSNSRDVLDGTCSWNLDEVQDHITADSCWALRRGRSYAFKPNDLYFKCDHVRENGTNNCDDPYLCVPIVAHGDTVGMLHLTFGTIIEGADIMDPHNFALRCAEHVSMAIANVKLRDELHDQSIRDPLTGLYNRRYFLDAIRRKIGHATQHDSQFALVSLDADRFKTFNDNHGHDAGDMVLKAISERMVQAIPKGGTACRMGGEEFALLLPGADAKAANAVVDKLRLTIAATTIRYSETTLPTITVSAGIAVFPTHGRQPQTLLKCADEALYAAKAAGRNCIITADRKT